jgi:hypothetical protein
MVMSLLVLRAIYMLFDWIAGRIAYLMHRLFAVRAEQLAWLIGECRQDEDTEQAETDSRRVPEPLSV